MVKVGPLASRTTGLSERSLAWGSRPHGPRGGVQPLGRVPVQPSLVRGRKGTQLSPGSESKGRLARLRHRTATLEDSLHLTGLKFHPLQPAVPSPGGHTPRRKPWAAAGDGTTLFPEAHCHSWGTGSLQQRGHPTAGGNEDGNSQAATAGCWPMAATRLRDGRSLEEKPRPTWTACYKAEIPLCRQRSI